MNKWKVNLSIIQIIGICIMVVGIVAMIAGVGNIIGIGQNKEINEVKLSNLKIGQYITGEVSFVCGALSIGEGDYGKFYPFCNNDVLTEDNTYICPMGVNNDEYIPITVSRTYPQLVEIFDHFSKDKEENEICKITGKITKQKYSYNEFPLDLLGVSGETVETKQISDIYEIKLVDFEKESKKWVQGVGILFTGVLLLVGFGKPVERLHQT